MEIPKAVVFLSCKLRKSCVIRSFWFHVNYRIIKYKPGDLFHINTYLCALADWELRPGRFSIGGGDIEYCGGDGEELMLLDELASLPDKLFAGTCLGWWMSARSFPLVHCFSHCFLHFNGFIIVSVFLKLSDDLLLLQKNARTQFIIIVNYFYCLAQDKAYKNNRISILLVRIRSKHQHKYSIYFRCATPFLWHLIRLIFTSSYLQFFYLQITITTNILYPM